VNNYYERVKAQPEIFKQFAYKDLLFIYYDCPLLVCKQDVWSQCNYLLYAVTGNKGFHTPDRSWTLLEGTAIFVKKGACIIERFSEDTLCLMAFFVPDSYLRSFLGSNPDLMRRDVASGPTDIVIPVEVDTIMKGYYQSVLPYFTSGIRPPEDLLELKFRELLLNILSNPANEALSGYLQTLAAPHHDDLRQIIEANCYYNLSLEDYAKLCNRSLSSFKRDFQEIHHTPPGQWFLNKRLMRARELLFTSEKSINDISFECGFENNTHFSRVFKKQFGFSPLQYRKQAMTATSAFIN
jgi:AraC family transcriptional regulator, exoenzyme S synthesis regulatory protein ExsA